MMNMDTGWLPWPSSTPSISVLGGRVCLPLCSIRVIRVKIVFSNHPSSRHRNFPARNGRHTFRIKLMLGSLNPVMQRLRRVLVQNRDRLLADDRAGIHARIHKMHRTPRHLHAVIQRLFPGFEAGKRRQQRRMDVHDAPLERAQKFALQHPHETRQHNQIHLCRLQSGDERPLGVLVQLGAELSRRDELRGNLPLARAGQNSRAFDRRSRRRRLPPEFFPSHRQSAIETKFEPLPEPSTPNRNLLLTAI